MNAFRAFAGNRMDSVKGVARVAVAAVAASAIMAGSIGTAEARRGGRVLQGIGIGIGTAIILNEVLKSGEQEKGRAKAAPTTTAPAAPRVSLDGERIRALQTALSAHGYDAGSPDGVWGNKARMATLQLQQDLGHPQTGTLTGEEIILLRDATAGRIPQRVTTRLDQAAAIADEGGLRSDSSQDDIRDMQSVLTQMGFYNGAIDGSWGRGVEAAVTRFQQQERAQPLGRLTLDQSERILGRTLAHATPPVPPANTGPYQGRGSEAQPPVRVMSVRPTDQPPVARGDADGLRFQDLPSEVRTHVTQVRATCKTAFEEIPVDHRKGVRYVPEDETQGIQQISLEGGPAIMVDNLRLCNDHIPAANCTNRGCDLIVWQFDSSGAWRQVFKEHLHSRELDIDPATKQLRSMTVSLYAGDSRCMPAPGRSYTSGEACKLNVTYKGGRWQFARELSQ